MSSLLVVTIDLISIIKSMVVTSVLGSVREYCKNLCTNQDLVFALGQKHRGPSDGWHPADSSCMCLGYCVTAHLPGSFPGHYSIGTFTLLI